MFSISHSQFEQLNKFPHSQSWCHQ